MQQSSSLETAYDEQLQHVSAAADLRSMVPFYSTHAFHPNRLDPPWASVRHPSGPFSALLAHRHRRQLQVCRRADIRRSAHDPEVAQADGRTARGPAQYLCGGTRITGLIMTAALMTCPRFSAEDHMCGPSCPRRAPTRGGHEACGAGEKCRAVGPCPGQRGGGTSARR